MLYGRSFFATVTMFYRRCCLQCNNCVERQMLSSGTATVLCSRSFFATATILCGRCCLPAQRRFCAVDALFRHSDVVVQQILSYGTVMVLCSRFCLPVQRHCCVADDVFQHSNDLVPQKMLYRRCCIHCNNGVEKQRLSSVTVTMLCGRCCLPVQKQCCVVDAVLAKRLCCVADVVFGTPTVLALNLIVYSYLFASSLCFRAVNYLSVLSSSASFFEFVTRFRN